MKIPSPFRSVIQAGLGLLVLVTATTSLFATNPPSATLSPSSTSPTQWTGTMSGAPPTGEGTLNCTDGVNCESFVLNIAAGTWTGKRIAVSVKWSVAADDYDLYIHQGSPNGPIVAQSAGAPPTTSENTFIDPDTMGPGTYYITVINAAAAESTDQYSGIATVVAKASGPIAAVQGTAPLPRYQ